jgi:2',3'-cyclic-nucleotide 2'-phosphodiesterase/3'-nucleotidase
MEDASLVVPREVPGFDLVLFGHDHARHNGYETSIDGSKTLCLDPANNAISVSKAEISLTFKKGKLVKKNVTGNVVDVVNEPIDEDFMNHFKSQIEKVNNFVDKPIGTFAHTIYTRDSFFGSSAFVDLIHNLQLQITGADISFNAPLQFDAVVKAGTIRVSDMFNLYKFENMLYVMNLTGEEIRKHLEMSYDLWVNTMKSADDHLMLLGDTRGDAQRLGFKNMTFNFDSAAGIIYEVDVTKPDGEKVKIKSMADGTPFDEKKWYKVALNSYRANGGGELLTKGAGIPQDSLENRIVWRSDRDQRHYLMKEIEKAGTLDPQPNNNWKFVPEKWTKPAAQRDRELLFAK